MFLPGHRLRLEVSSSNFPRYDRNPNTGAPFAHDATTAVARQTVFHDAAPSLAPRAAGGAAMNGCGALLLSIVLARRRGGCGVFRCAARGGAAAHAARLHARGLGGSGRSRTRFRDGVSAESMSALHEPLTERPHPAGSDGTRQVVAYLQKTLAGFGLEVQTHEYQVLLDRPRKRRDRR